MSETDERVRVLGKWTRAQYVSTSASGITDIWVIRAIAGDALLADVKWFGRWRQYVLAPTGNTVWNPECLNEVSRFVASLTAEHRKRANFDKHSRMVRP